MLDKLFKFLLIPLLLCVLWLVWRDLGKTHDALTLANAAAADSVGARGSERSSASHRQASWSHESASGVRAGQVIAHASEQTGGMIDKSVLDNVVAP